MQSGAQAWPSPWGAAAGRGDPPSLLPSPGLALLLLPGSLPSSRPAPHPGPSHHGAGPSHTQLYQRQFSRLTGFSNPIFQKRVSSLNPCPPDPVTGNISSIGPGATVTLYKVHRGFLLPSRSRVPCPASSTSKVHPKVAPSRSPSPWGRSRPPPLPPGLSCFLCTHLLPPGARRTSTAAMGPCTSDLSPA